MINFKANTGTSGGGFTLGTQNPTGTASTQLFGTGPGTGFVLGQQQTQTAAGKQGFLGTPVAQSGGGFSFGTLATSTAGATGPTTSTSGFALGPVSSATPAIGQQIPAAAAAPMGGFSFGTQQPTAPAAAAAAATGGFSFGGTTAPTAPITGFGVTPTAPITGFGVTPTAPITGFGVTPTAPITGFGVTPTAPITGFGVTPTGPIAGFGVTPTPASSAGTGFPFGGMATTPASTSGFSMGTLGAATPAVVGSAPASSTTGFSFVNTSQPATIKPPFGFGMTSNIPQTNVSTVSSSSGLGGSGMGLGGAQPPSANACANSTGAKSDGKSAKEQQLPHDLFGTIAVFESWRNRENSSSEENIRQTAAPFHKVGKKAEEIQQLLSELASEYLQLHASAVTLKADVMKEAEHVEMARRTKDTPMALQGENKSPEVYFINLVRNFEAEMIYCRNKIDEVSLCMQAANNPCETPEDIAEVLQREHETLKELASKVYAKHSQLVELSHRLNTKAVPNDQEFFRPQCKQDTKSPASAVVRPVLRGSISGLQAFQEQQQRAKAVTLGAAPPTMPLAQTTTPSLFGSNTGSSIFTGGSSFGTNTFNLANAAGNTPFGPKSIFGNAPTGFGNNLSFGVNTSGVQQSSSPFSMNSPFATKPFGS